MPNRPSSIGSTIVLPHRLRGERPVRLRGHKSWLVNGGQAFTPRLGGGRGGKPQTLSTRRSALLIGRLSPIFSWPRQQDHAELPLSCGTAAGISPNSVAYLTDDSLRHASSRRVHLAYRRPALLRQITRRSPGR